MRNRERINGQNGWHNRGSGTQGAKGGESLVSKPLNDTTKKGTQPTLRGIMQNIKLQQIYAENSVKIQRKQGKQLPVSQNSHYRRYLDSKGFKFCKSQRHRQPSKFVVYFAYLDLVSHLSEHIVIHNLRKIMKYLILICGSLTIIWCISLLHCLPLLSLAKILLT